MARTYEQEREHKWRRRGIYGITYAQYKEMHQAQRGQCAICGQHVNGNGILDHDHATGKARGILCNTCNLTLGHLEQHILSGHVSAYLQLSSSGGEEEKHTQSFTDQNGLQVHDGSVYGIDEQGNIYEIEPIIHHHPSEF